jgi:hypothetical protein
MIRRIRGCSSPLCPTFSTAAVANLASVLCAVGLLLVVSLGPSRVDAEIAQRGRTDTVAGRTQDTPRIIATPECVKVIAGFGSATIAWNTGGSSSRAGLLHHHVPWLLIAVLAGVLYIAIYLSSTGPQRTEFPAEPTTSPHPLHVARNLLLGLAAFICVDGAVFHTRVYTSMLAPDSYAGRMEFITRAEKARTSSGLKEVLVLGDSRMAEGFSAAVANQLSSVAGFRFVNLAEPACAVNLWHYMLREVDPTARRYWAIVVPYGVGFEPNSADPLRISMAAPLLRYGDCINFASAFQRWSGRFRAFTACILRGSAFQSDVLDLLQHPIARIRSVQQGSKRLRSRDSYKGRDYDIVGTSYDPKTGLVTLPSRLTEAQREALRESLVKPSQPEIQDFLRMQRDGIRQILDHYSASPTEIVLTPVPRGPFAGLPGASMTFQAAFPTITAQKTVFSLPEQTFNFLEMPEYYFDGYHLNAKGRQRFTETLVTELVGRLGSTDWNEHSRTSGR